MPFIARFDDRPDTRGNGAVGLHNEAAPPQLRSPRRPPCRLLNDAELLRVDVPRTRRRTRRVLVPDSHLVELGINRCSEATRQRLLHAPLVGCVANARTRSESFAAKLRKRNVVAVDDGIAGVTGITLNQHRSRAAPHICAHKRQQRASVLELGCDRRPESRVPVADFPRKRIHRIERRERQPEQ